MKNKVILSSMMWLICAWIGASASVAGDVIEWEECTISFTGATEVLEEIEARESVVRSKGYRVVRPDQAPAFVLDLHGGLSQDTSCSQNQVRSVKSLGFMDRVAYRMNQACMFASTTLVRDSTFTLALTDTSFGTEHARYQGKSTYRRWKQRIQAALERELPVCQRVR